MCIRDSLLRGHFPCSRGTSGMQDQQWSLCNDEVSQAEQTVELCLVLRQPLVANLLVPEKVLDHVERMLDLCSNTGLELLGLLEQAEQLKASVRAKVEHPFHVIKNLFRHKKVRYKGLAKNQAQLYSLFGLANLVIAKRPLLVLHARGAS